jgi:hypothetical protein
MRVFARPRRRASATADAALGQTELERLAAEQGRPVEELLREVAAFRLALETDLALAAAATELDQPVIAAEAVEASRSQLAAYGERLVSGLTSEGQPARRPRRRPDVRSSARRRVRRALHSTPALVTALVLGAAGGFAVPRLGSARPPAAAVPAMARQQLATLETATASGNLAQASSAGAALHATLTTLVGQARAGDADAAHQAANLLIAEQQVLAALPPAVADPLRAQVSSLASVLTATVGASLSVLATTSAPNRSTLRSTAPSVRHSLLPSGLPLPSGPAGPAPSGRANPTTNASGEPKATATPTAHGTPSPSPSASRSPSASPSPGPISIPSGSVGGVSP